MKYLLDADSVIDHLSQRIDLFSDLPGVTANDLGLSAVTLVELYTGVYSSSNPRQADRDLRRFLRAVTVIPFNQRVIHATARLRAAIVRRKQPIHHRAYDNIVAAAALEYRLTVVTSNTRDYQDIAGLTTLDPRTGQVATH